MLQIRREPIGSGQERVCYLHPDDETRLVKISKGDADRQTRRDLVLYARLMVIDGFDNRTAINWLDNVGYGLGGLTRFTG